MTALTKSLFDKIWEAHEVAPGLIYIDLHLVHEVTSPQAFDGLRLADRKVRRPDRTLATADHNVPTDGTPIAARIADAAAIPVINPLAEGVKAALCAPPLDQAPPLREGRIDMLRNMVASVSDVPSEDCPVCLSGGA